MKLKWFFAALLLANLGLWMWASWYKEPLIDLNRTARSPVAPAKMRMLSESGANLVPRKTPLVSKEELAEIIGPACFNIGPFTNPEDVTQAGRQLSKLKLNMVTHVEDFDSIIGYRVYLPPLASKQAAERKRQELTQLGFKDHALILEEGWQNAISLGLFSIEANAENRVQELATKGIKAETQLLRQARTFYWLDIVVPVPVKTGAELKAMVWGDDLIQARVMTCPTTKNTSQAQ